MGFRGNPSQLKQLRVGMIIEYDIDFTVGECNCEIECLRTEQRLSELGGVREPRTFSY